jgi:hypothetical protein
MAALKKKKCLIPVILSHNHLIITLHARRLRLVRQEMGENFWIFAKSFISLSSSQIEKLAGTKWETKNEYCMKYFVCFSLRLRSERKGYMKQKQVCLYSYRSRRKTGKKYRKWPLDNSEEEEKVKKIIKENNQGQ